MTTFSYDEAFSRNIGWITQQEQQKLRNCRIAIAGMGGVGGAHLLTLSRLGIGKFNISDLDEFEVANFNRQAGANMSTLGRQKVEVLEEMAKNLNPEQEVKVFPNGVTEDNVEEFLDDVDLYVDGLDYFAVSARRATFAKCHEKGIPAVTAAPLGIGAAVLNFLPGGMSFEEYFRLEGKSEMEQLLNFLIGLSPAMLQRTYLADPATVDLANHKGPSTPMAVEICAGMAASQAMKILLKRGPVKSAPWGQQFDGYRDKYKKTWRPGGNNNPIQKLTLLIAKKQLGIS